MPSGLRGGGTLGPRPRTTPNHRTLVSHLGQLRQSPVISLDTQLPLPSRKYLSCRSLDVGTFDAAQNGPHDERGWLGTTRSCQERQAMTESQAVSESPLPRPVPVGEAREGLWAIVLARGEGVRLRPLTRRLYAEERPKQYAVLTGSRSLLPQTLDRAALAIPPERTVVVTLAEHARYLTEEFRDSRAPHVLAQPRNRGTAAGILLPAHWIHARDPKATVVVFPSDHFILEEAAFMRHVAEGAAFVQRCPEWVVLLGAQPTEAETEYGWIE